MSLPIRFCLLLIFSLLFTTCEKDNDIKSPRFNSNLDIEQNINTFVNTFISNDSPGLSMIVVKENQPLFKKSYGMADIEKQLPVHSGTPFYLASVSKQFTAMCIMILEERGLLDYDDQLKTHIPEIPNHWDAITIHHLLTHQSGIFDYLNDLELYAEGITNTQMLDALIQHGELEFTPGAKYEYSNSGYLILAIIVDRVSGQPFQAFLRENIFEPLGMNNSLGYDESRPDLPNRAIGYLNNGKPHDYDILTMGDGGMFSTIDDLYKWDQSLYTDQLVNSATLELAFTSHESKGYGYGWDIRSQYGSERHAHGGAFNGFRTQITRFPEKQFSVIILSNGTYEWVGDLHDEIIRVYL